MKLFITNSGFIGAVFIFTFRPTKNTAKYDHQCPTNLPQLRMSYRYCAETTSGFVSSAKIIGVGAQSTLGGKTFCQKNVH